MFAKLLAIALVAHAVQAAPKPDCTEFCDDAVVRGGSHGGYNSRSSYSSYSKSSYGSSGGGSSSGRLTSSGLGSSGARLENFDTENVVGVGGQERPGSWQDEKNYITNDGRGKLHYKAGQTVTNNGYSKFAEHSYSYGTNANHAGLSNAQVLSTAQFNQELQSIRQRMSEFMGNFALGGGAQINSNFLENFKNQASSFSQEMNNVCSQLDSGSAAYQQMRHVQEQFERQVEQRQREIVAEMSSSSSSNYVYESSSGTVQPSQRPAPIVAVVTPRPEDTVQAQRINQEINTITGEISNFWSSYQHVEASSEWQENFKSNVEDLTQKIRALSQNTVPTEGIRQKIMALKSDFKSYIVQITNRIEETSNVEQEEQERRLQQRVVQVDNERKSQENSLSIVKSECNRLEQQLGDLRLKHRNEENNLQIQLDHKRSEQQSYENEKQRLDKQRLVLQQEKSEIERKKYETQSQIQSLTASLRHSEQLLEHIDVQVERPAPIVQVKPAPIVQQQPQVTSSVHVSGSSSVKSHVSGSYGAQVQGSGYTQQQQQQQQQQQVWAQPHVDNIAMISKLQQDLNRLMSEVNNFNTYNMRLTSSNSASIISEANSQASTLRQRLEDLCSNSRKYHNQQLLTSAEELQTNFDNMFKELQSQAASYQQGSGFAASSGYSSQSSWGTSGKYAAARNPVVSDLNIEHTKSTEVEIKGRPSRVYNAASSYGSSSSYKSGSSQSAGQVDCVEALAGQPCPDQVGRAKREAGEFGTDMSRDRTINQQQRQPAFDDDDDELSQHYGRSEGSQPSSRQLEDYLQSRVGPDVGILSLDPNSKIEDSLTRARLAGARNDASNQRNPSNSQRNQDNAEWLEQRPIDTLQQVVNREEDLDGFQRPRSEITHQRFQNSNPREQSQRIQPITVEESVIIDQNETPRRSNSLNGYSGQNARSEIRESSRNNGRDVYQPRQGQRDFNSNVQKVGQNSRTENPEAILDLEDLESSSEKVDSRNEQVAANGEQTRDQVNEIIQNSNNKLQNQNPTTNFPDRISNQQPTIKPDLSYARVRDAEQFDEVTKKSEKLINHADTEWRPTPLRGDLPGISEPEKETSQEDFHQSETERPLQNIKYPPITTEKYFEATTKILPLTTERISEIITKPPPVINPFHKQETQKINCTQNHQFNQFGNSNGRFFFNHSIHHKYKFTQQSNYYTPPRNEAFSNLQTPLNQQNSFPQFNHFLPPTQFNQRLEPATYQYHTQQARNYKYQYQQNNNFKPHQFGQQINDFDIFKQSHEPFYGQPSRTRHVREFNQQSIQPEELYQQQQQEETDKQQQLQQEQRIIFNNQESAQSISNSEAEVRQINNRDFMNELPKAETTTQQPFWKRVGHKISSSYDKAKETAKNIFG